MTTAEAFRTLMQSRGTVEPDEDVLEDGVAFAGVAKYPARVKCALLSWMAWKDATVQALATGDTPAPAAARASAGAPALPITDETLEEQPA
jgi:nitrogen fixation NifU-like protein